MTDDRILLSHARDLKMKCADNSMITNTFFLDIRQRSLLSSIENEQREFVTTVYFGGFPDSERTAAIFIPSFFEISDPIEFFKENKDENPLSLIKIEKDRFSALTHRDYLGALMGLGIKREMLGDLIVNEDGCFVPCIKSVARYITENLTSVGRGTVKAQIIGFEELEFKENSFTQVNESVASLRLDNMVSAAFSLSRSASVQAIEKGLVYINSVQSFKTDYRVAPEDKLVLRGKGKVIFSEVTGKSKKGRLHVCFKVYK